MPVPLDLLNGDADKLAEFIALVREERALLLFLCLDLQIPQQPFQRLLVSIVLFPASEVAGVALPRTSRTLRLWTEGRGRA